MLSALRDWWSALQRRTARTARDDAGPSSGTSGRAVRTTRSQERAPRTYLRCPRCPRATGPVLPGRDYVICDECATPFRPDASGPDGSQDLVWITKGASVTYHLRKGCYAREAGQKKVENRGGVRAPLTQVTRATAQARGRAPCEICTPRDWRV